MVDFSVQNVCASSPEILKVTTPKHKYNSDGQISYPIKNQQTFDSPTFPTTPTTKAWVSELINLPSPIEKSNLETCFPKNDDKKIIMKNRLLQKKLRKMKILLKEKQMIINRFKKNNKTNMTKKTNINQFFQTTKFPSLNSKALISMQLIHKKRKPWSINEKKVALSLYYKSPSTYKYMRKNGIVLPGESTVRRWLNSINYETGYSIKYMEQLKIKTSNFMYDEKKCVILLDEVSIMKSIEYNKVLDEIEGFEDLGQLGRTDKFASHALVIMIRGLYTNWKFPFSYFFTGSGVKGDNLVLIVENCVQKLLELDLIPTSIVCDQGTQNRRMFSLFGGTENNPSTVLCGKKLFLIYDMPHLIKSIRNNLLTGDFKIDEKLVSLNDIRKTHEIDTKNSTRAMLKITPTHLSPNPFQKMSCKLAIQLLSRTVSSAIKTCVSTGELKSKTALNTALFIEIINDMFDSGNSKNLYDPNPNRRPMCGRNLNVIKNLKKASSLFKNAEKINHKNKKSSVPPCFTGIIWTTTALCELFENEKNELAKIQPKKELFLMTNRLTQDALENLFSIMRQKNGYNRNPTARMFRCCFGHICTYSLMKCSTSCNNCEPNDDEYMTVDMLKDVSVEIPETIN